MKLVTDAKEVACPKLKEPSLLAAGVIGLLSMGVPGVPIAAAAGVEALIPPNPAKIGGVLVAAAAVAPNRADVSRGELAADLTATGATGVTATGATAIGATAIGATATGAATTGFTFTGRGFGSTTATLEE